jgi:hypothetical protein
MANLTFVGEEQERPRIYEYTFFLAFGEEDAK